MATKFYNEKESSKKCDSMMATDGFLDSERRKKVVDFIKKLRLSYIFSIHQWNERDINKSSLDWFWIGLKGKNEEYRSMYYRGFLSGILKAASAFSILFK